ncbi:DUF883 family protein [Corticibacter populi]|uniref:DUF883 family protein n=1 Tax=Corticibacter populi TaxID=1550736 RepID=A0A3M6QSC9_9BURK|nr:DUF883 family protein [Corticibacter populi]RMX05936.1 DUF883 family protein [Corticibacter populi]RZS30740.1 ElaB/YqjD/DUF883 family membrane-anchored ribosome-binding protein [Corticibacter populi]
MGVFNKTAAVAQDDLEKLVSDLRGLISSRDLDDLPQIRQLREKLDDGLHSARQAAVRAAQDAAARAKDGAHAANRYAHDEPWQIAGAAIALGALVGYLVARR